MDLLPQLYRRLAGLGSGLLSQSEQNSRVDNSAKFPLHAEPPSPFTWFHHSSQHTLQQRFDKTVKNLFVKLRV